MTRKQLRALEHLPAVVDALETLVAERQKLLALMGDAAPAQPQYRIQPALGAVAPSLQQQAVQAPPLIIQTPERQEYEAMKLAKRQAPVSQTYDPAEEPPPEEPPHKQRQRELLEAFRKDPRRQAALQQFAHDGTEATT